MQQEITLVWLKNYSNVHFNIHNLSKLNIDVRLACVKHLHSVHSELSSNSNKNKKCKVLFII
jgi:hypothetical protein